MAHPLREPSGAGKTDLPRQWPPRKSRVFSRAVPDPSASPAPPPALFAPRCPSLPPQEPQRGLPQRHSRGAGAGGSGRGARGGGSAPRSAPTRGNGGAPTRVELPRVGRPPTGAVAGEEPAQPRAPHFRVHGTHGRAHHAPYRWRQEPRELGERMGKV